MKAAQERVKQQEGGVIWHTQGSGKSILMVMITKLAAFTWFINDGYSQITQMQRIEAVWQKKAPQADISRCDGKPCVKVDIGSTYGDKENTWMIIKK
ncbi:hypothetical protein ABM057_16800 [Morganella morganii]